MNVFLTGSSGYIGTVIAEQLQQAGHSVIGLARSETAAAKLRERKIQPLLGDLRDLDKLAYAAEQSDGVVHTAFAHDWDDFATAVEVDRSAVATFAVRLLRDLSLKVQLLSVNQDCRGDHYAEKLAHSRRSAH